MKKIKLSEINKSGNIITSSEKAIDFIKEDLDLSQENFLLIGVDTQNKIRFIKTLFKGGIDFAQVDIRLIFKEILVNGCNGFIIAHNHPSGNLEPSENDKNVTSQIAEISKILELRLLDHLIFDNEKYISFYDEDLL